MRRRPLRTYRPPPVLVLATLGYTFGPSCSLPGYVISDPGPVLRDTACGPDIDVDPREVDFGSVDTEAFEEVVQAIQVCNRGCADLQILDITLDPPDGAFEIASLQSVLVSPDDCSNFELIFHPEAGEPSEAVMLVESRDPDEPEVEIPVTGEGLALE